MYTMFGVKAACEPLRARSRCQPVAAQGPSRIFAWPGASACVAGRGSAVQPWSFRSFGSTLDFRTDVNRHTAKRAFSLATQGIHADIKEESTRDIDEPHHLIYIRE